MMNRGSMDGGGEERAIGDLDDFLKDFILLDLGARDPSVWSDVTPSLDQAQAQSIVDKERVLSELPCIVSTSLICAPFFSCRLSPNSSFRLYISSLHSGYRAGSQATHRRKDHRAAREE